MKNEQKQQNSRRKFIQSGITLGALFPLLGKPFDTLANPIRIDRTEPATQSLKILILGGTTFLVRTRSPMP
ncbi:MAG: hypothetical protein IPI66_13360 [Chitinophagaceae bacterium]|nr:hypothetical protein [Chitinophagaceae bacterium]